MPKLLRAIVEDSPEDFKPSPFNPGANLEARLTAHYHGLNSHAKTIRKFSNRSENVNHYLWERHKNPLHAPDGHIEGHIEGLDNVVHHTKTPEDMTVYSKVEYDPINKMNSEKVVHHPAFMSTSINKNYAKAFRANRTDHHVLAIHLPKGSPGGYIGHISDFPEEKEHLLPRAMNLKISHTESETHARTGMTGKVIDPDRKINYHIHHATIVSHHEPDND